MGENRINHESGIHKRIACLIGAVLVVLICITAAVPVSATVDFSDTYSYIAQDSYGIIYLSEAPLSFDAFYQTSFSNLIQASHICAYTTSASNISSAIILVPFVTGNDTQYKIYVANPTVFGVYNFNPDDYSISAVELQGGSMYKYGGGTVAHSNMRLRIDITSQERADYIVSSYRIKSNYSFSSSTFSSNNLTIDSSFGINDAVGQSGITEEQIKSAINSALNSSNDIITGAINGQTSSINGTINSNGSSIVGAIQTQTNTFIAYGNNFIQFLPTDKADTLETKQNALHDAESALDTKSKSLVSKASAGLATATASAGQLAANLAQPVAVVSTVITDFTATVPDEVKPVLTAAPLLSSIVWLIGLRR